MTTRGDFRVKLYAAFSSIATILIFAVGLALYSSTQQSRALERITGEVLPEALAALRLAERSASLAASAPTLANAEDEEQLQRIGGWLGGLIDDIHAHLMGLDVHVESETIDNIGREVTQLGDSLRALKDIVQFRNDLAQRQTALREQARHVHNELIDTISPVVYGVTSLAQLSTRRVIRGNRKRFETLRDKTTRRLTVLLELRILAQRLIPPPVTSSNAAWTDSLSPAQTQLSDLKSLLDPADYDQIETIINHLISHNPSSRQEWENILNTLTAWLDQHIEQAKEMLRSAYQDAVQETQTTVTELVEKALRDLEYALDIKAEGNLLFAVLMTVPEASNLDSVALLQNQFKRSIGHFRTAVRTFLASALAQRNPILATHVTAIEQRLWDLSDNAENPFSLRREILQMDRALQGLLTDNRLIAEGVTARINLLVSRVQADSSALQTKLTNSRRAHDSLLITFCIGGLLLAGLITYFTAQVLDQHERDLRHAITVQREAEQRIKHLAYYDTLTHLANRTLLNQRAEFALALAARRREQLAVLFLDLDRFKEVNDALGHAEGDALLVLAATQLKRLSRETDTVCRLGGDEFVLLLPDVDPEQARQAAERITAAFRQPFAVAGHSLRVTVSIGIALYPDDGTDFNTLLKNADTALYKAKREGRNALMFYDWEMNAANFEQLVLETQLREAIESGQLRPYFQPKVRLNDGRLIGAEALVRWQHPQHGLIPPGRFIPVAESSDLIVALGNWMLEAVCQQLSAWRQLGLPPVTVAVNLAARHFRERGLAERLRELFALHGLTPASLELELTESALFEVGAGTAETLLALQQLGVSLAIDDFGTGYSSLSYLKRLPITVLKIDQSFVCDLAIDQEDRLLAATIVTLAHSLGLQVVAEGVETEEQRCILLEQGCDFAQGYLFSPPMSAQAFTEWLTQANCVEQRPVHGVHLPVRYAPRLQQLSF